jgi:SAM-dependent methyltransferase
LELGPGDNLGTGAILLDNGAKRYTAFDRNDLLSSAPTQLYDQLGKKLKDERSRQSIKKYLNNQDGDLEFFYDTNFKLLSLPRHDFNLVVSQAAFEHFENPQRVISELARVCLPGAVLCAEIDLATHSRWIRDVDPNNIYRFPTWLYSILKYSGIPNRVRPNEYKEWLAANGWKNIRIIPLVYINKKTHGHTLRGLRKDFNDEFSDTSSFVLLATFSGGKKQSE